MTKDAALSNEEPGRFPRRKGQAFTPLTPRNRELVSSVGDDQKHDADFLDAVERGIVEYAEMLLDNNPGIDIDFQEGNGRTVLVLAAYYHHVEMTSLILGRDPDLNTRDSDGAAAIDFARASIGPASAMQSSAWPGQGQSS